MKTKKKIIKIFVVVGVLLIAVSAFAVSVSVSNFSSLVNSYMNKIWNSIVQEQINEWTEHKQILALNGFVPSSSPQRYEVLKQKAYEYSSKLGPTNISLPQYQSDVNAMYNQLINSGIDFTTLSSDYGDKLFIQMARAYPLYMTSYVQDIKDKNALAPEQKIAIVKNDVRQKNLMAATLLSVSALSLSEEMDAKYRNFDPSVWDNAYETRAVKDIAKIQLDNLKLASMRLRIEAHKAIVEAMQQ